MFGYPNVGTAIQYIWLWQKRKGGFYHTSCCGCHVQSIVITVELKRRFLSPHIRTNINGYGSFLLVSSQPGWDFRLLILLLSNLFQIEMGKEGTFHTPPQAVETILGECLEFLERIISQGGRNGRNQDNNDNQPVR